MTPESIKKAFEEAQPQLDEIRKTQRLIDALKGLALEYKAIVGDDHGMYLAAVVALKEWGVDLEEPCANHMHVWAPRVSGELFQRCRRCPARSDGL
jgi:hypothetical protein